MMATNSSIEPNSTENSDPTWQSFKLTKSIRQVNGLEHDFPLLKDNKNSILGDISIVIEDKEYSVDRAILASKSDYVKELIFDLTLYEKENDTVTEFNVMPVKTLLENHILDIIYDNKDMKYIMKEDNFVQLLHYMQIFKMEVDLEIINQFIKETVEPKEQLNIHMCELLNFLLIYSPYFDYLLPIVSQYFSTRLPKIYKEKAFLSLSAEGFISILLCKSDDHLEKNLAGRLCAEWICHEYQNRIKKMKDLVNATKYRYGFLPYCYCDLNTKIESLPKNQLTNEPDVSAVEKFFNELQFSLGEAKFDVPSELIDILNAMKSEDRVVFPKNQTDQWVSFLENEIFCDVAISVHGSLFKLHRIKLCSVSGYFYDLFTNPTESLASEVDKSDDELEIRTLVHDRIDPETFRSIVRYIYRQEIEVTSKNHLISLLRASKFLKMYDLFENCSSKLLNMTEHDFSDDIIEIFQYVCENGKYSELYNMAVEKIIGLWPKLDQNPQFLDVSLDVFSEIVAQPDLQIDNTDQVLDLCSKWIFHDIQNRYKCCIEVARAINRNYMMDTERLKLEIPQNPIDFSQQYVKEQLIRILSSTVLVPAKIKNFPKDEHYEQKPCFLTLNKNHSLCVLDSNFNELIQLPGVDENRYFHSSATVMNNQLFILFHNDTRKNHFQLYDISSKRMTVLAADARMNLCKNFVILSCKDDVYFCNDKIILKYSVELNRWINFLKDDEEYKQYTSDGEKLYKIFSDYNAESDEWENKASYYDFKQDEWTALPNVPIKTETIAKGRVNIIKHELSMLLKSITFSFNWVTQKWNSVSCSENFVEFTADEENIIYVSKKNEVHLYSPIRNEWTFKKKLDVCGWAKVIHKIYT